MIRILVADDHAVVRQGIKQICADTPDVTIAAETASGPETLERARHRDLDVVVLDLTMPGSDGLEILQRLRRQRPALPLLVLTMHSEDQFGVRALQAGAAGYLTKESAPTELIGAIRKVAAGEKYLSPHLAEKLALQAGREPTLSPHERLSDREYQVLLMIASGKTPTAIAGELSLSVKTVSTYRARMLTKMRMKSNADLIAYAIRSRLID